MVDKNCDVNLYKLFVENDVKKGESNTIARLK